MYVIVQCISNTDHFIGTAPWDIARVADFVKGTIVTATGQPTGNDLTFPNYFPDAGLGYIQDPATIVDRHGRVITWHLPGILSRARVVTNLMSVLSRILN